MRHAYDCQMRWADMDMLGHVNNVTYLQYAQEARLDLFADRGLPEHGDLRVLRHSVQFRAPLVYDGDPVRVECWVSALSEEEVTLAFEVVSGPGEDRVVYFSQLSVLAPYDERGPRTWTQGERAALAEYVEDEPSPTGTAVPGLPAGGPRHVLELHTRSGDLGTGGLVDDVRFLELFQEARIRYVVGLPREEDGDWAGWVVAALDQEFVRVVPGRRAPYAVDTWIDSVGNSSLVVCSQMRDGDEVVARCRVVMVGFDASAQRAAPMNPRQRARLVAEAEAAHGAG